MHVLYLKFIFEFFFQYKIKWYIIVYKSLIRNSFNFKFLTIKVMVAPANATFAIVFQRLRLFSESRAASWIFLPCRDMLGFTTSFCADAGSDPKVSVAAATAAASAATAAASAASASAASASAAAASAPPAASAPATISS